MITLRQLRYLSALAKHGHFGRAAEACFVSQPTLSVAIKKLEDELNVQIFERGTSEVSVTPIGEQIVTQAQRVLEQTLAIKEPRPDFDAMFMADFETRPEAGLKFASRPGERSVGFELAAGRAPFLFP